MVAAVQLCTDTSFSSFRSSNDEKEVVGLGCVVEGIDGERLSAYLRLRSVFEDFSLTSPSSTV